MTCETARRKIRFVFSDKGTSDERFIVQAGVLARHLTKGSTVITPHTMDCQPCCKYYESKKRPRRGG